jgi:hypothetical protein
VLGKLGIKKVDKADTRTAKVQPQAAPKGKRGKEAPKAAEAGRGFGRALAKVGVKAEPVPTKRESESHDRHENIRLAWLYLRAMIDKGVKEFYQDGTSPLLDLHVERPVLDALKERLTDLRTQGIYWEQPSRRKMMADYGKIEILEEELDGDGVPVQFKVREVFRDFSFFQRVERDAQTGIATVTDSAKAANGNGRDEVLIATVRVVGDDIYQLLAIERETNPLS